MRWNGRRTPPNLRGAWTRFKAWLRGLWRFIRWQDAVTYDEHTWRTGE